MSGNDSVSIDISVFPTETLVAIYDGMSLDNTTEADIKAMLFELWDRGLLSARASPKPTTLAFNDEERALAADTSLTAKEIASRTGRSPESIHSYRYRNGIHIRRTSKEAAR